MAAAKRVVTLTRRADFKRLSRGLRRACPAFTLQAAPAVEAEGRFGLTVTRKVGNAPERNRIKRRLRAAAGQLDAPLRVDAVVLARRECLSRDFVALCGDLEAALAAASHKLAIRKN